MISWGNGPGIRNIRVFFLRNMIELPSTLSEKIFATLLKRGMYASSGMLVSRVGTSLAAIVIARRVGPGMFGVYATVLALIEFSTSFTQIGLTTGLKREGSRSPASLPQILGNVITIQSFMGMVSIGIAFAALPLVSRNPLAMSVFLPLALMEISVILAGPFLAVLQVRGEQRLASLFVGGRGLVFFGGIVTLASFRFDVVTLAWYHGISYFVVSLVITLSVVLRVSVRFPLTHLRDQIKGALPFGLSSALNSGFTQLPVLFLSHFATEENVGNFAVALRFVNICILVGGVANAEAFLPALFGLFRTDRSRFAQVCSRMQRLYIPGGVVVSSALYVCSEVLVVTVQGGEYRGAIRLLRILCWSVALIYGRIAADAALTAGDRMKVKLMLQAYAMGMLLFISLPMIGYGGATGASYTKLCGDLGLLVLMISYAYSKRLYSFSGLPGISIPAVITLLVAILSTHLMPGHYFLAPILFAASSLAVWYLPLRRRLGSQTLMRSMP
jgi:O-antigen/teichoic acid export membrane protein